MTSKNIIVQNALNAKALNDYDGQEISEQDAKSGKYREYFITVEPSMNPNGKTYRIYTYKPTLSQGRKMFNAKACNAKFKVGDKVKLASGTVFTVERVDGNKLWVGGGRYVTDYDVTKVDNSVACNGGSFGDVAPNTAKAWHEIMNKCGSANGWQIDVIGAAKKDSISTSELMSVKKPYDDAIQAAYTAAQKAFNYFSSKK